MVIWEISLSCGSPHKTATFSAWIVLNVLWVQGSFERIAFHNQGLWMSWNESESVPGDSSVMFPLGSQCEGLPWVNNEKTHSRDGQTRKKCVSAVDRLCVLGPIVYLWLIFIDFLYESDCSEGNSPRSPRIPGVAVTETRGMGHTWLQQDRVVLG